MFNETYLNVFRNPAAEITDIRLSSEDHGLLEVKYNNVWGIVSTYTFTNTEALVACRMLDKKYTSGQGILFNNTIILSAIAKPVWMTGMKCKGNESSLSDCPRDSSQSNRYGSFLAISLICRIGKYQLYLKNTVYKTQNFYKI